MCNAYYSACVMRLKYTIIINIISLYFIQITHTDDFPSTGTRLVMGNLPRVTYKVVLEIKNK